MAKLEIFNSKQQVQGSNTPNTSALALPLSLAKTVGSGVNAITKSIADIQKDLYAIEDNNQLNEILPGVKNFEEFFTDVNKPVVTLLKNKIAEKKALLVPKLVGQISTNTINKFVVNLDKQLDTAITKMISKDQAEMAEGTIAFENLTNNKAYESYIGAKAYAELIKKKTNLKNKLLLNSNLQINPESILENKEALREAVGSDLSEEYVKEAKLKIISDLNDQEQNNIRAEIAENNSQIGAFSELILRINESRLNPNTERQNEVPTINELYQIYEDGMINEPMFIKLSNFLSGDDMTMTDQEIFDAITVQIFSAKTIQQLDDIKNSYILDNDNLFLN